MVTTQTKIHLISLVVAVVLIGLMYFLLLASPKTEAPLKEKEDSQYSILIESATYGMNCQKFIEHNNGIRARSTPPREQLAPITQNNVLRIISRHCSTQRACEIYVSPQVIGIDPAPNCAKNLAISYRCFSFDNARSITGIEGKTLTINCNL